MSYPVDKDESYKGTAPPPYSGPPPMYNPYVQDPQQMNPPGMGMTTNVVTSQPVAVVTVAPIGPYPAQMTCPSCGAQVSTATTPVTGLLTWLICGALIFFGCWVGCCLIPFCVPECQDIEHRCPNCKANVGLYRRL